MDPVVGAAIIILEAESLLLFLRADKLPPPEALFTALLSSCYLPAEAEAGIEGESCDAPAPELSIIIEPKASPSCYCDRFLANRLFEEEPEAAGGPPLLRPLVLI